MASRTEKGRRRAKKSIPHPRSTPFPSTGTDQREGKKGTGRAKAFIFIGIALFFFAYMVYSGGSTGGYLSLVIGLVCGLLGVLYLREDRRH